ncbi:MAG: 3-phosphoglycerate dehydrogenase, partial [Clostridia bacterium]|nr:3-phosphoglycerate dehydrogenase [Clostridia bacterium]
MYKIKTYNKISKTGLAAFDDKYTVGDEVENADGAIVRSAALHEVEFPASLKAIARAGAGTNNIPIDRCSEQGIVVFNTPGANANAVKELVIAGMLISSRRVIPAIEWAKTLKGQGEEVGKLVEKGKSAFGGPELKGKTLGVIGLGAIGVLVANAANHLGMTVYGYDPYLSVNSAWNLTHNAVHIYDINEIFRKCDYITIHVPLVDSTKNMINKDTISLMKDGVRILNFARAGLVNSADIKAALESGKVAAYVTDFPTDDVLCVDGVIAIPHLGASTPESEDNCASMAAKELIDYIENGN